MQLGKVLGGVKCLLSDFAILLCAPCCCEAPFVQPAVDRPPNAERDKAGIREALSTRAHCVWRISKLIQRVKSLTEPVVYLGTLVCFSGRAPVLGDQSVTRGSTPISEGLSAQPQPPAAETCLILGAIGGEGYSEPTILPSLTWGMWGHTEPFHSPTLMVLLPSWSPVTERIHSLDGDADDVQNHPLQETESHQELSAFQEGPAKGWCICKDGQGSNQVICEAGSPNLGHMQSISAG